MVFIEDQLRTAIREKENSGRDWCVTLESKNQPENWVQLTWQFVNLHYPFDDDPATRLGLIDWPTSSMELDTWDANTFVTLAHSAGDSVTEVAAFVRRYVSELLQDSMAPSDWNIEENEI